MITVSIIIPKKIFYGYYTIIGVFFIFISSLLITCFVRNAKERILAAQEHKMSFVGIFFLLIGLITMNTCTIGAPICGVSAAAGLMALLFPGMALGFLSQYGLVIILFSLLIQTAALYYMSCFKAIKEKA